jgi:hypothetical protein
LNLQRRQTLVRLSHRFQQQEHHFELHLQ